MVVAPASIEFSSNSLTTDDADVMTCVLLISLIVSDDNCFIDMVHGDFQHIHETKSINQTAEKLSDEKHKKNK